MLSNLIFSMTILALVKVSELADLPNEVEVPLVTALTLSLIVPLVGTGDVGF